MLANILELRAHAKRPALESETLIEANEPADRRPKDQLALLHLKRLQELNSHPDELQQMLEILDYEEAKTRIDPGDD